MLLVPKKSSSDDFGEYVEKVYNIGEFKYLVDISKPDNSKYEFGEPIILKNIIKKDNVIEISNLKYYSTKYLKTKPIKYFNSQEELNEYVKNTPIEEKSQYNLQIDYSKNSNVKVTNL